MLTSIFGIWASEPPRAWRTTEKAGPDRVKSKVKHLYVDLPDYLSPTMITGEDLRPDMVICDNSGKWYLLELTCCYEANISKSVSRKEQKYDRLIKDLSTTRTLYSSI